MSNTDAVEDLASLMNGIKITAGMESYLHSYSDGELISLADEVSDGGQYINYLKEKFRVNDANWVWNVDTANQKIDDLILEYHIILASNKVLPKNISYAHTINEWCECTKKIRLSYQYAKNDWEELSDLMSMLYEVKRNGNSVNHIVLSPFRANLKSVQIQGCEKYTFLRRQIQHFCARLTALRLRLFFL